MVILGGKVGHMLSFNGETCLKIVLISVHFRMKSGLLSVKCVDNCGTFIGKSWLCFAYYGKKSVHI